MKKILLAILMVFLMVGQAWAFQVGTKISFKYDSTPATINFDGSGFSYSVNGGAATAFGVDWTVDQVTSDIHINNIPDLVGSMITSGTIPESVIHADIARDSELHSAVTIAAGVNAITLSGQELNVDALVEALADLTPTNNALLGFDGSGNLENKTSITTTILIGTGTTLPATCTVGQMFIDTDATAGAKFHVCYATNTWEAQ